MAKRPGKTRASDAGNQLRNEPNVYSSRYRRMRSLQSMNFNSKPECRTGRPQSVNCCAAD